MEKKIDYIKVENDKFKKEFGLVLRQIKHYKKIACTWNTIWTCHLDQRKLSR